MEVLRKRIKLRNEEHLPPLVNSHYHGGQGSSKMDVKEQ